MEELVLHDGILAVAVRTQQLRGIGQPQVLALQVLRPSLGPVLVGVMTGWAADTPGAGLATRLVEHRHLHLGIATQALAHFLLIYAAKEALQKIAVCALFRQEKTAATWMCSSSKLELDRVLLFHPTDIS